MSCDTEADYVYSVKTPNYRCAIFDQILDPGERNSYFIRTLEHGLVISQGAIIEEYVHDLVKASGRFSRVERQVSVRLDQSSDRKIHKVDHWWEDNNVIKLVNAKSLTRSNTDRPSDTVKLYVEARRIVQQQNPHKSVSYDILRIGGKPISEYEKNAVHTFDMNTFLSELCNRPIDVVNSQELQSFRKERRKQQARELSVCFGQLEAYGVGLIDLVDAYRL